MKYSTRKILEFFPMLKDKIPNHDSILLEEQTLNELNETEQVFLKMIWFFESPSKNNFNLYDLLKYIDKDWLSFALECIVSFFENDTYLLKDAHFSIIKEGNDYMNQTRFADFLNEHKSLHGKNFSRAMLNTYLKRGVIPEPDLIIGNTKYWEKDTCRDYLDKIMLEKGQFLY